MTNQIKNFIEEGEKEFEKWWELDETENKFMECHTNEHFDIMKREILNWHSSRQISLIKMIVEMCESEKKTILDKIDSEDNKYWKANRNNDIGFNKGLDTISSKLKTIIN